MYLAKLIFLYLIANGVVSVEFIKLSLAKNISSCNLTSDVISKDIAYVFAPCTETGSSSRLDVKKCDETLASNGSFVASIQTYYKNYLDCYYQGHYMVSPDMDFGRTESIKCSEGVEIAPYSNPVVCNLSDNEDVTNHLGQKCGKTSDRNGKWELSQRLGLRVLAIKSLTDSILQKEVIGQRKLKISSMCSSVARDYAQYLAKGKALSDCLNSTLDSKSPPECNVDVNSGATGTQMGACYLSISGSNLVWMFSGLIKCEVEARLDYVEAKILQTITNRVNAIFNECYKKGESAGNEAMSESKGNRAFDSCYNQKMHDLFSKEIPEKIKEYIQVRNSETVGTLNNG